MSVLTLCRIVIYFSHFNCQFNGSYISSISDHYIIFLSLINNNYKCVEYLIVGPYLYRNTKSYQHTKY
jgi:hypothetical protein